MKINIDIDVTAAGLGAWLTRALSGLHASTNAACELRDALAALSRETPVRGASDAAILSAYAEHGTIAGAARATGLARSTVRAHLARLQRAAELRDAEAANDTAAGERRRAG